MRENMSLQNAYPIYAHFPSRHHTNTYVEMTPKQLGAGVAECESVYDGRQLLEEEEQWTESFYAELINYFHDEYEHETKMIEWENTHDISCNFVWFSLDVE